MQNLMSLSQSAELLKAKKYNFHDNDESQDKEDEELDEINMLIKSDATKYIVKDNIAITCARDNHNDYLPKLLTGIYEIKDITKDD